MAEIIQKEDTRRVFIDCLTELGKKDKNVILIVPDVGFNYINKFKEECPNQFLNVGVTEQFAVVFASTLALDGWKSYLYSMINFVLFRPAEMVRNGIVNHKANVKLIGVKGSEKYKFLGFSHNLMHESEDINFCENISLKHYIPENNDGVTEIIKKTYQENEPCYIRL